MLTVEIEELNQKYPLRGGDVVTYAVLRLPNNERLSVPLKAEQVEIILAANGEPQISNGAGKAAEAGMTPEIDVDPVAPSPMSILTRYEVDEEGFQEFLTGDDNDPMIAWPSLPDDILPKHMKDILSQVGAAKEMPASALQNLVDEISERMMQQAQGVLSKPPSAPKPAQPNPVQPVMGKVQLQPVPTRRTVPMDDAGYPIVPGLEQDPGEIAMDADEDGVSQL